MGSWNVPVDGSFDRSMGAEGIGALRLRSWHRGCSKSAMLLLVSAVAGCNQNAETAGGELPARFVAFRESRLLIDRLDTLVKPSYAVGSTPSEVRLLSSDLSVVGVDSQGNLIGHRNGKATITAPTGSTLEVVVRVVRSLSIVPDSLNLDAGSRQQVRVVADGDDFPAGSVQWTTSDPDVAAGSGTTVQAGFTSGECTLTAMVGGVTATTHVAVHSPSGVQLAINPSAATVRAGSIQQFRVDSSRQVPVSWDSTDPTILKPLRDGVFYANRPGESRACAIAGSSRSCALVRVTRQ